MRKNEQTSEYDVGSVAPKCALSSSACAARARPPRTGDEDVIGKSRGRMDFSMSAVARCHGSDAQVKVFPEEKLHRKHNTIGRNAVPN